MTNEKDVLGIKNAEDVKELDQIREMMRNTFAEHTEGQFLTGFVLLDHPLTQIHTASPSGQSLANCILFSDENTEDQIIIQLNTLNAIIQYLTPLIIAAEMFENLKMAGKTNFSAFEIGLINKLLEMKQKLIEKGIFSSSSEEVNDKNKESSL